MSPIHKSDLSADPIEQFGRWLAAAEAAGIENANAMTLATADSKGRPSARMLLLKGYGPDGFVFFTNYESQKGRELDQNPYASLVFYWRGLRRQVRVSGPVERLSPQASNAYFASRPSDSRLSAAASPQSQVVADREELEERVATLRERYAGKPIPRPEQWGGYRLAAEHIEFWQDGLHRLHDRFRYTRAEDGGWKVDRLAP